MYVSLKINLCVCVCIHKIVCGCVSVKWKSVCVCQHMCMSSGLYSCVSCVQESEVVHIVHLTGSKIT